MQGGIDTRTDPKGRAGVVLDAASRHVEWVASALFGLWVVAQQWPVLVAHARNSASAWFFTDDARIWIAPLFRYEDPASFQGDRALDYMLTLAPDGFKLLYRTVGLWIGVEATSKCLPYVLLFATLGCLGLAIKPLGGRGAVIGAWSLSIASGCVLSRMAGGLPRAFALPFIAAGAACLVHGRIGLLAAAAVLAVPFYPSSAFLLGATLAVVMLLPATDRGTAASWSPRLRAGIVVLVAALACVLIAPSVLHQRDWGRPILPDMWREYPEAGPGGRVPPNERPPFPSLLRSALDPLSATLFGEGPAEVAWTNLRAQASWLAPLLGAAGLLGWILLARRRADARRLAALAAAVVACHVAARIAYPRLYSPERYFAYGVPVLALIMVPSTLALFMNGRSGWWRALPVAFNLGLLCIVGARGSARSGLSIEVSLAERPLFRALAKIPPNAVVAGWPDETTDSIPYLSRRSVLVTRETHVPFQVGYTELMRARMDALIDGYLASTNQQLRALRDGQGVTHLLVRRSYFKAAPNYFAPFGQEAAATFAERCAGGFAALRVVPDAVLFQNDVFTLIDLSRI